MTYWVAKVTGKSVDRFPPVTSLDNTLTPEQLNDPKGPYFTLNRKLPLTLLIKPEQIKHIPLQYPPSNRYVPSAAPTQQVISSNQETHSSIIHTPMLPHAENTPLLSLSTSTHKTASEWQHVRDLSCSGFQLASEHRQRDGLRDLGRTGYNTHHWIDRPAHQLRQQLD